MTEQLCLNDAMLEGAKEVFETMIFMDVEKSSDPDQNIEGQALLGSITFTGSLEGRLTFCCGISCARAIAINMLGIDTAEQLSEKETCDTIGEVANMLLGSVKTRIFESFGNLEVSVPSVVSGWELQNNPGEGTEKISVKLNIQDEYITELSFVYSEIAK